MHNGPPAWRAADTARPFLGSVSPFLPLRPLALALTLVACGLGASPLTAQGTAAQQLGLDVAARYVLAGDTLTGDALGAQLEAADGLQFFAEAREGGAQTLVHVRPLRTGGGVSVRRIPLWLSILPPLIAIGLALLFKEVVSSLFFGILAGAFVAGGMRVDGLMGVVRSVWEVSAGYVIRALNDSGHLSVIVFSLLIGGMVALISRNGGMAGVVRRLAGIARDRGSAQLATYLLGVAIFFDDYANTLIVGNTMRSVTGRFGVSREKLAYLVDATAAPIASVAFITTWIGAELGYIESGIDAIGAGFPLAVTPYAVFLESLKYSFYPVFTLVFMLLLIRSGRDFGPMLAAERDSLRAFRQNAPRGAASPPATHERRDDGQVLTEGIDEGEFAPVAGAPLRARDAIAPVLTVVLVTIYGLLDTGAAGSADGVAAAGLPTASFGDIWSGLGQTEGASSFRKLGILIGNSDSYVALLWASLTGVLVALGITLGRRVMSLEQSMETMLHGFKTMLPAIVILALAWSLAAVTEDLQTAAFLKSALVGNVSPVLLPGLVFVLAAFISFSTGSSWSTMAILYPIAIPTTWAVATAAGFDVDHSYALLLNVVSTVLAASVLGDHCSPISDTTILSSLASGCDHLAHVRTQLPYALTVGVVALAANVVSSVFDGGWLLSGVLLLASTGLFVALIRWRGRTVEEV